MFGISQACTNDLQVEGFAEVVGGADQGEVGKGLRKVSQLLAGAADFFAVKSKVTDRASDAGSKKVIELSRACPLLAPFGVSPFGAPGVSGQRLSKNDTEIIRVYPARDVRNVRCNTDWLCLKMGNISDRIAFPY
jgi:hypothetical protein